MAIAQMGEAISSYRILNRVGSTICTSQYIMLLGNVATLTKHKWQEISNMIAVDITI